MTPTTDLLERLRSDHPFPDIDFDGLYPPSIAALADRHFTPVDVARRAACMLVDGGDGHILDVGSGVGKFCIVGALVTGVRFTGVEHRQHFVEHARELARRLRIDNAEFVRADATTMDWDEYDGIYLFNPFAENLWTPMDSTVPAEPRLFHQYVHETKERLRRARRGTRVVTFHGFGASMPAGYRLAWREPAGADLLDLWIKEPRVFPSVGVAGGTGLEAA